METFTIIQLSDGKTTMRCHLCINVYVDQTDLQICNVNFKKKSLFCTRPKISVPNVNHNYDSRACN